MRLALFISKTPPPQPRLRLVGDAHRSPRASSAWSALYGIVVPPRAVRAWRERPNAGGERRR